MFADNPAILLSKVPVPVPPHDLLSVISGFGLVLQQIPRSVIAPPPSAVTLPPLVAVVEVIAVTVVVAAMVGATQAVTVNVLPTLEAALKYAFPTCAAVMVVSPAPCIVTVVPLTVATASLLLVKVGASSEVLVAVS